MTKLKEIRQLSKLLTKQVAEYLEVTETKYLKLEDTGKITDKQQKLLSELYCIPLDEFTNLPTPQLVIREYAENFSIEQLKNSAKANKEYMSSLRIENSI